MLLLLLVLAANEGRILEARLEAAVDDPDVAVRLAYRVEPSNHDAISFFALEIDGVALEEVEAFASGAPIPVDIEPRTGPKRVGSFRLPQGTDAFELRYLVRGGAKRSADGLRVRLPCAILDLRLEEKSGLFSSAVGLPEGMQVVDGYPAQSVAGAGGTHHWELPIVPAFLSFRASSGTEIFTPSRLASAAVLVLFLSVGIVGVRRARSVRP